MRWFLALFLMGAPAFAGPLPQADAVFAEPDMDQVRLGWHLFYDPILSGNRTVACATCHHPRFATGDGLSLGLGDGGIGIGPARRADPDNPPEQLIPRNAPALFNLGASEFDTMFHDGRLEADPSQPGGIRTPLGQEMVAGFSGVLSAQSMFPVLSPDEMAGHYNENEISRAVRMGRLTGEGGAWDLLSARIEAIPAYRAGFDAVIGAGQPIGFTDISDAIAAFIGFEWRADDSPFDRFLRGGPALPEPAARGMALFYGSAGCDACHAGQFQTDHDFHALAVPQIGPGKAARFETHHRDEGRMRVTGDPADAYAFRTPSLRNVVRTAPYGHSGAYATLEGVIRHHLDPVAGWQGYDPSQAVLPDLSGSPAVPGLDAPDGRPPEPSPLLAGVTLSEAEIADIITFLHALTDGQSLTGRLGVPDSVPSGLPVPHTEAR
jgi:cytochrome c peroxidase